MRFEQSLIEGTLLRRQKKFAADVKLNSGEEVTVHCAHPGSLSGCLEPGNKVLVSVQESAKSKFKHHLEIIYTGRTPVAIHSGRQATIVAEALGEAKILELAGYAKLRREAKGARNTRIDLVVEGNGLRACYMKIETVTLVQDGVSYFPDVVWEQGPEAMQDLTNLVREGHRAMIMFLITRADVERFRIAEHIDPDFVQAFRDAVARGVEPVAYRAKVSRRTVELDAPVTIDLSE
ncbi:MAG: DNA/RNA nuclease SfsA [Myxococcota bacterium]